MLLKRNIALNVNSKNRYGNYPLIRACYKNYPEIVNLLIGYANQKKIYIN